jgi:hypothetical protein
MGLEAAERRLFQVGGEHERALGGRHEYISRLKKDRQSLIVHGQPARALHNGGQFDLLGWRESERSGPSGLQATDADAAAACQSQNACERGTFHF